MPHCGKLYQRNAWKLKLTCRSFQCFPGIQTQGRRKEKVTCHVSNLIASLGKMNKGVCIIFACKTSQETSITVVGCPGLSVGTTSHTGKSFVENGGGWMDLGWAFQKRDPVGKPPRRKNMAFPKHSRKWNRLCGSSIVRGGGEFGGKQAMWAPVTSWKNTLESVKACWAGGGPNQIFLL